MKCPLITIACASSQLPVERITDKCLRKECAWWNAISGECAMHSLAYGLIDLRALLATLVEKMPHAGQFTK